MTQFLILNGALDLRSNRLYAIVDQANPLPTGSAFELFYDGVDADWFDTQTDEFLRLNGLKDAPVSIVRWDGASPPLGMQDPEDLDNLGWFEIFLDDDPWDPRVQQ